MEVKEIIIEEKQKKKKLDDILSSFCSEIKSRKRKLSVYRSYLVRFHDALVCLPYPFQIAEAKRWTEAVSGAGIDLYSCTYNEHEEKAFEYITDTASKKPDFNIEVFALKRLLSDDKEEIKRILGSKRYEIGRCITKKKGTYRLLSTPNIINHLVAVLQLLMAGY